jgi:hypothetical protein
MNKTPFFSVKNEEEKKPTKNTSSCINQAMLKIYTSKQLGVTMRSIFSVAFGSLRCSSGTPVTYNNKNDRYNIAIMY